MNNGTYYPIQRGILSKLARTLRGGIEAKLQNSNPELLTVIQDTEIGIDGLHVAICQAYIENEERAIRFIREQEVKRSDV